jgi:hypothetical protein
MSKLIRQSSLINFLLSNKFNIESNSHSLRSKVCEIILSKRSKAWQFNLVYFSLINQDESNNNQINFFASYSTP